MVKVGTYVMGDMPFEERLRVLKNVGFDFVGLGLELFRAEGDELERAAALCEKYGFEGISPVLGHPLGDEVDFSQGKKSAAKQIFYNNIRYINNNT